jgi:CDP-4-dehydro-6-deoxyglucose reductase, E1
MIKLIKDTIDAEDRQALADWVLTNPQLTKGPLTEQFEAAWSNWLGVKYSLFVNSGSSANLLMVYAMLLSGKLKKGDTVAVSALSWATTVAPLMQLGLHPVLVDVELFSLGASPASLEQIFKNEKPKALILVHILGIPCEMTEIIELCNRYNVFLLEDSCESVASEYKGKKTGTFGLMSTFSFYYGHFLSTVEGGMLSTNDIELYYILKSIRSNGWDRELPSEVQKSWRDKWNINNFKSLYTFYYPGFNFRPTDLQAFLGLRQMEKIERFVKRRILNLTLYDYLIINSEWKLDVKKLNKNRKVVNFAYPILSSKMPYLVDELQKGGVEVRPLVCGSIGYQPFWAQYGKSPYEGSINSPEKMIYADRIEREGIYLPNNPDLTSDEIGYMCNIVNSVVNS